MGCCIMRIDKIKTEAALSGKYKHNFRQEEVPNADRDKQGLDKEMVALEGSDYVKAVEKRIASSPEYALRKPRRDAVKALELMLTYSSTDKDRDFDQTAWSEKKWRGQTRNSEKKT